MLAIDRPRTGQALRFEIRSRHHVAGPVDDDLAAVGVAVVERSRLLLVLPGPAGVTSEHVEPLIDALTESFHADDGSEPDGCVVDVLCKPGVLDAEGETACRAIALRGGDAVGCRTGTRWRFARRIPSSLRSRVERCIGNPLIHVFEWSGGEAQFRGAEVSAPGGPPARIVPLRDVGDAELAAISGRFCLALDGEEMRAVAAHYTALRRDPTDVELQSIALTWSEHCCHKTFKARIEMSASGSVETIDGLLEACFANPTRALARPWVRSAFSGNAGVIAFNHDFDVAFKAETHNHPTALEPFGGAHTGVGGVIRDVLAMSAEPIANTDVLCFGMPDTPQERVPAGAFHPARTMRDVVRGVADYGNNMGIPTVGGAVLFHPGYSENPVVFCGTLGIAPRGSHPDEPRTGDLIVLIGGRTGRDGLHGATMSSEALDRQTAEGSTVQIGDPIQEKVLRDVLPLLRDERLYSAITDCGAGGLCSAVGEMAERLGADVRLDVVPLKYRGLSPWEIWLSEAQERMVLAVPKGKLARLMEICRDLEVEASTIGTFRGDARLRIRHGGMLVADIELRFLHGGRPRRTLQARWDAPPLHEYRAGRADDAAGALLRLLAHPNVSSKEGVIRRYDHQVGAHEVVGPLVGNSGSSDAAVLRPTPSYRGIVIGHGINPLYGRDDPYQMAMLAVDEALRNVVAVGGSIERAALLDNFSWGEVDAPEGLGGLVRAALGCRDAALAYRVPFVSGKDSLRNVSEGPEGRVSIPGTLLVSALGVLPDVRRTVTMNLKRAGSHIYLAGLTREELGGSHYLLARESGSGEIPRARPKESRAVMRRLNRAIRRGLVLACHDLSEGGLAVTGAEMAIAGDMGLSIRLEDVSAKTESAEALLFSESAGRFLIEVDPGQSEEFEGLCVGIPVRRVGTTTAEMDFVVTYWGQKVIDLPVERLAKAWRSGPCAERTETFADKEASSGPEGEACARGCYEVRRAGSASAERRIGRKPGALVLTGPGINCDPETVEALRLAGAEPEAVHVNRLLDGRRLGDFRMLVLPGGFSYGDHLGSGTMLAAILRRHLLPDLLAFIRSGRPVLGICNGMQVLARLGLLGPVSLAPNVGGRFECRWVDLTVAAGRSPFLGDLERIELPIAHGEGRVVVADGCLPEVAARSPLRYKHNPNGSAAEIAGIQGPEGAVFGLMPHPERYVHQLQHPGRAPGAPHGLAIFRNAVRYARCEL